MRFPLIVALLARFCLGAENIPVYDPEYGVYIGDLSNLADGDIHGKVYVVNETALQILNFTYNGKASGRCALTCSELIEWFSM